MPKVTNIGEDQYGGWDGDETIVIEPGQAAEVSEAKAAQLLEDFPHRFEAGEPAEAGGDAPKRGRRRTRKGADDEGEAGEPAEAGGDADEHEETNP